MGPHWLPATSLSSSSTFIILLFSLVLLLLLPQQSLSKPTSRSPTTLPTVGGLDLSKFDQYETAFFANKNVSLFWSIENYGDIYNNRDQVIHMAIMLNVTGSRAVADRAENMANTWFIMVHALPNGVGVEIQELVTTGSYQAPTQNPSGTSMMARNPAGSPPHVVYQGHGILLAEFRRYTTPSQGQTTHVPLDLTKDTNILLAYNSNPKATPAESWKVGHGRNTPTGDRS
ncbi:hypothetical protein HDU76_004906, partial [Blyttiomyces sp. JEL0837]